MQKKKETTLDDLALMIGKGFNSMDERFKKIDKRFENMEDRFDKVDKDFKLVRQDIEDVKLRLDNVAYRFELKDLEDKFEKRIKALELKAGLKRSLA